MIMEQAFVSNAIDAVFLSSEESLKALGVADATAIAEYYGLRLKTSLYGLSDATEEACRYQEIGWQEIGWLAAAGIATGYSDGTFRPEAEVTRRDMAAFLYRLAGSPSFEPTASDLARFSDVDEGTDHYKEILWLASAGITMGFDDGTFRPGGSVAREDMAAFRRRIFDYLTADASEDWESNALMQSHFTDVGSSTWHAEDIW